MSCIFRDKLPRISFERRRWQHALETRSIPKPSKDLLWPQPPAPSPASARKSPRRAVPAPAPALSSSSSFLHNVHALVLPDASLSLRWSSAARDCVSLLRRHGARCSPAAAADNDTSITHVIILAPPSELSSGEYAATSALLSSALAHSRAVAPAWLNACVAAGACVALCEFCLRMFVCLIH